MAGTIARLYLTRFLSASSDSPPHAQRVESQAQTWSERRPMTKRTALPGLAQHPPHGLRILMGALESDLTTSVPSFDETEESARQSSSR